MNSLDALEYVDANLQYMDDLRTNDENNRVTIEEIGQTTLERELKNDRDVRNGVKENNPNIANTEPREEPKGDQGNQD